MKCTESDSHLEPSLGYYLHQDGGVYEVTQCASHSEDQTTMVVYRQCWPFPFKVWVRPLNKWSSNFTPISETEAVIISSGCRKEGVARVSAARASRKGQPLSCEPCLSKVSLATELES